MYPRRMMVAGAILAAAIAITLVAWAPDYSSWVSEKDSGEYNKK